ncbi:MAG: PA2169 family four-helix-bundle protein [Caldimonas sp.]
MTNDDTIDQLNTLIETCKDGEYGFRTSAEHAKSGDLKSLFMQRSADCQRGAQELQAIVSRLGGKPEADSSMSGTMHRGWVSVVGTLTGYSDQQMLDECERGEDVAMDRYRAALKEDLPADVMSVVQKQYEGVKRNHDQIRTLRNQVRAAT